MKVTKADLVKTISRESGIEAIEAEVLVESLLALILKHLEQDNVIEIRGFGTFKLDPRSAKKARNPYTNELMLLPAQKVPSLKFTREFKKKIAESFQSKGMNLD